MRKKLPIGIENFEEFSKENFYYVDKTMLIDFINKTLGTKEKLTCVSRPRRFGKSFATQMLCAYYDKNTALELRKTVRSPELIKNY